MITKRGAVVNIGGMKDGIVPIDELDSVYKEGDAILVMTPNGNMLIDSGESTARDELAAYLKSLNVTSFEYVVFTHPDSDHIGNADYIIENYSIKNIIIPDRVATSKTYERMMDAIEKSQANPIIAKPEYEFYIGALLNTILAPNDDYDDTNDASVVIKATFGETSIMLTGDAEKESEADMVKIYSKDILDCDVLKVGHHGSSTSSSAPFLMAATPTVAAISCGKQNSYGFPHAETLESLTAIGAHIFRTDLSGTLVFGTDGCEIRHIPSTVKGLSL